MSSVHKTMYLYQRILSKWATFIKMRATCVKLLQCASFGYEKTRKQGWKLSLWLKSLYLIGHYFRYVITRPSKLIGILKKAVIDLFRLAKCINNNFKYIVCFQSSAFVWSIHFSCVLWIMVGLNHDDAVPSSELFLQLVRQWSVSDRPQCYTELTLVHLLHTPLHQTVQGWHVSASCSSHQGCKSGGIVTIHPTGSICSQLL